MINAFLQIKIGRDAKTPLSLSSSTYFLLQILLCCCWSGQSLNCLLKKPRRLVRPILNCLLKKNAQAGQANPSVVCSKNRTGWSGQSLKCLLKKHRRREELTYISRLLKHLVKLSINTYCFEKSFLLPGERRLVRKNKT